MLRRSYKRKGTAVPTRHEGTPHP